MSDRLMQLAAFLTVAGFLGVVLYYVPRLDLGAVIIITLVGIGYDFLGSRGSRK